MFLAGDLSTFITEHGGKKENMGLYMKLTIDMLRGLQEVHSKGHCHRDIKPANVFLMKNSSNDTMSLIAKLGNFGQSNKGDETGFSIEEG